MTITVITDRYGGMYSGAKYLAFNAWEDEIPTAINGSDKDAETFWRKTVYRDYIGKGETPENAIRDLRKKVGGRRRAKYHYLQFGELIREGDQYDASESRDSKQKWRKVPAHVIGLQAPDPLYIAHTKYRRIIRDQSDKTHSEWLEIYCYAVFMLNERNVLCRATKEEEAKAKGFVDCIVVGCTFEHFYDITSFEGQTIERPILSRKLKVETTGFGPKQAVYECETNELLAFVSKLKFIRILK